MIDKEHKFSIGRNEHSWEVGYDKGYQQGKADGKAEVIDECIELLESEEWNYKIIAKLEQLKEKIWKANLKEEM